MSTAPDLFEREAFETLKNDGIVVERTERVAHDYWVTIGGEKFDALDLRDSLAEAKGYGNTVLTFERQKMNVLKRLGVVEHEGSMRNCMGASMGPNYREFMELLREKIKEKRL